MANFNLRQSGQQVQADLDLLDNNNATNGQVLTADGNGGCAWANAGGGGGSSGYTVNCGAISVPGMYCYGIKNDGTGISINQIGTYTNIVAIFSANGLVGVSSGAMITFDSEYVLTTNNIYQQFSKVILLFSNCDIQLNAGSN